MDPKPKLNFYLMNDRSYATTQIGISLSDRIPNIVAGMSLQRNNINLSQKVNSTLKYTLNSTFNLSKPLKVSIMPMASVIGFIEAV